MHEHSGGSIQPTSELEFRGVLCAQRRMRSASAALNCFKAGGDACIVRSTQGVCRSRRDNWCTQISGCTN